MFINFHLFSTQSLLHDFNKEQEAFIKDQSGKSGDAGVCPWVGHKNEDKIKEEVLNLSGVSYSSVNESVGPLALDIISKFDVLIFHHHHT